MHWGNSIWRLFCKAESSPSFHMLGVHLKTPITMRWHSVETDVDTLPGCQRGTGSGMSFWDGKQVDSGLGSLHWSRILVSMMKAGEPDYQVTSSYSLEGSLPSGSGFSSPLCNLNRLWPLLHPGARFFLKQTLYPPKAKNHLLHGASPSFHLQVYEQYSCFLHPKLSNSWQ